MSTNIKSQVTTADQKLINRFARLHQKSVELKEELRIAKNDLANINDASDEISLLDDECASAIPVKIGTVFIYHNQEKADEILERMKDEKKSFIDKHEHLSSTIQDEMNYLKSELYGKFGDRINLETDKED
ncbi:hypothetical protein AB6A40_006811 [Gnathostoma spinigerum]|uniref:Prefoldin subunit 4 n=1 Tax=Gnathostoma spinigerum TaxID=75299 RepID=A0ABD6ETT8_9BILA